MFLALPFQPTGPKIIIFYKNDPHKILRKTHPKEIVPEKKLEKKQHPNNSVTCLKNSFQI